MPIILRRRTRRLRNDVMARRDHTGADLEGADLTATFLTGAQLNGADLRNANLTAVYALATDFGDARMDGAIFNRIVYDQGTTWASGMAPPGRRE